MGSLLEIPMYFMWKNLIKKYDALKLLRFSALVLTGQFVLFGLVKIPILFILVSALQIFTTPIILVASKMIISQIVPSNIQNSAQLIALSIFMGGSSLVIPILTGWLSVSTGINLTIYLLSVNGIVAYLTIIYLRKII